MSGYESDAPFSEIDALSSFPYQWRYRFNDCIGGVIGDPNQLARWLVAASDGCQSLRDA
jgi:hypothetical protein